MYKLSQITRINIGEEGKPKFVTWAEAEKALKDNDYFPNVASLLMEAFPLEELAIIELPDGSRCTIMNGDEIPAKVYCIVTGKATMGGNDAELANEVLVPESERLMCMADGHYPRDLFECVVDKLQGYVAYSNIFRLLKKIEALQN